MAISRPYFLVGRLSVALAVAAVASLVLAVAPAPASFGVASFEASIVNRDGTPDIQAGSHPYAFRTRILYNTITNPLGETAPDENVKDLQIALPPGLIGNPSAAPKCTIAELNTEQCPQAAQVGVVTVIAPSVPPGPIAVYNLVPPDDVPAQFGFVILGVNFFIDSQVRTGGDYGITSSLSNIATVLPVTESVLTVWGVPGDPGHNGERQCVPAYLGLGCAGTGTDVPLLTMPTSCPAGPLTTTLNADSWQHPENFVTAISASPPVVGCEQLSFKPSLTVRPESEAADSPTGLEVDLKVPQEGAADNAPGGESETPNLATADLRDATLVLPAGLSVNPAAANGLQACSPVQIGLEDGEAPSCPDASKIGSVEIDTPLLADPLRGSVYIAQQGSNPFGSLLAIYVTAEADGALIKLAGHVVADPNTGQLTTTFDNNPQMPFSELKLIFFDGPSAALTTPEGCGTFTTSSDLMPWSAPQSGPDAMPSDSFNIDSGCGGGFAPSFSAGTTNNQAGGFSPLSVTFSRTDQEQGLGGVTIKTPPGLLGVLKSVALCPEPQAAQGTCGPQSLIGHTTVGGGAGPDPVYIGGQVFLTGPYKGAPFGLSIVVPAVAGPFNLGNVVVRAAISVDPATAALTVTSDPLPSILQGIPLKLRTVNVTIDRTGFTFNPTDCEPLSTGGTLTSLQGTTANVSSHFQAANCAALPFKPVFTVSTQAGTSKKNGASLLVKGSFPAGNANIHSVAVTLPKQLPARLTTIQQACTEAVFNANPASCPVGSNIGTATASTPILAVPLAGPVYLVSHGGAAFPDIVAILQGEGVTVDLTGSIDIKHDITSSTFASVPDAPITSFALTLPEGPHSGLAAVVPAKNKGSLCGQSLSMPFTITAQNGAVVKQPVKIAVTGCAKAKAKKKPKTKHTKAKKK